jgi:ankyrin repeat protein
MASILLQSMDLVKITKNIQYLTSVNMGLSDKLDKVINPKLCQTARVAVAPDPGELKNQINKPKLWITRVKKTSKIQSSTPKGGSKELLGQLINKEGQSLLHQASFYGKISIIQKLIKEGANVNQEDWSGTTPLLYAIKANQVGAVKELLRHSSLKIQTKFGHRHETAVIKAVKAGNFEIVKEICRNRPECIGKLDVDGRSPLFHAIIKGSSDMVAELVEAGSREKELIDYKGLNAVYLAMEQGEVNSVETLLKFNEFRISEGICEKLLLMACYGNKKNLIHALMPHFSVNTKIREEGLSPLIISYTLGFKEVTLLLMDFSLNEEIDYVSPQGKSLLALACWKNDAEIVDQVVQRDGNVNLKDEQGKSPLHVVCEKGFATCLEILLKRSVDINLKDKNGFTPAALAAAFNQSTCLARVLARGGLIPKEIVGKVMKSANKEVQEIIASYSNVKRNRKTRFMNRVIYD